MKRILCLRLFTLAMIAQGFGAGVGRGGPYYEQDNCGIAAVLHEITGRRFHAFAHRFAYL